MTSLRSLLIATLTALAASGCVYLPGNTITLDDSVTAEYEASFREAARAWTESTGERFEFTRETTPGRAYVLDTELYPTLDVPEGYFRSGSFAAFWHGDEVHYRLFVADGLTANQRLRAIEHELGHWMGLGHVDDKAAVMHQVPGGPDLTASDIAEYSERKTPM